MIPWQLLTNGLDGQYLVVFPSDSLGTWISFENFGYVLVGIKLPSLLYSVANIVEHLCGIGWIFEKEPDFGAGLGEYPGRCSNDLGSGKLLRGLALKPHELTIWVSLPCRSSFLPAKKSGCLSYLII